jgi:hypothetical protein
MEQQKRGQGSGRGRGTICMWIETLAWMLQIGIRTYCGTDRNMHSRMHAHVCLRAVEPVILAFDCSIHTSTIREHSDRGPGSSFAPSSGDNR